MKENDSLIEDIKIYKKNYSDYRTLENLKKKLVSEFNKMGNILLFNRELLQSINLILIPFSATNGKIGFINKLGEIVVEPKYDDITGNMRNRQSFVSVCVNKEWSIINSEGKELIPRVKHMIIPGYDSPFASIQDQSNSKVVNVLTKETVVDSLYDYIDGFRYGFARVRIGNNHSGKWGIINESGQLVLNTEYSDIYRFYDWPKPTTIVKLTPDGIEQIISLRTLCIK